MTDADGILVERTDYSPYGVARHRPPADLNGDGAIDGVDQLIFFNAWGAAIGAAAYNPDADINFDGAVNGADFLILSNNFGADPAPPGAISKLGNTVGYSGYIYDEAINLSLARFRWHDAETGRWATRDPVTYYGGHSLYAYVGLNPLSWLDSYGLMSVPGAPANWPSVDPSKMPNPKWDPDAGGRKTSRNEPGRIRDSNGNEWRFDPAGGKHNFDHWHVDVPGEGPSPTEYRVSPDGKHVITPEDGAIKYEFIPENLTPEAKRRMRRKLRGGRVDVRLLSAQIVLLGIAALETAPDLIENDAGCRSLFDAINSAHQNAKRGLPCNPASIERHIATCAASAGERLGVAGWEMIHNWGNSAVEACKNHNSSIGCNKP